MEHQNEKIDALETPHRNLLQMAYIELMLGRGRKMSEVPKAEREAWFMDREKAKRISDLIDLPGHEDIRALAREGKYTEAAELLRSELEKVN